MHFLSLLWIYMLCPFHPLYSCCVKSTNYGQDPHRRKQLTSSIWRYMMVSEVCITMWSVHTGTIERYRSKNYPSLISDRRDKYRKQLFFYIAKRCI
jgi:hypothetical protein